MKEYKIQETAWETIIRVSEWYLAELEQAEFNADIGYEMALFESIVGKYERCYERSALTLKDYQVRYLIQAIQYVQNYDEEADETYKQQLEELKAYLQSLGKEG